MFIIREKGMKGLRILMVDAKIIKIRLKYLKCLSSTLSKNSSISLVLLTYKVQGKTVILPNR